MLHPIRSTLLLIVCVATACCPATADEEQADAPDGHASSAVNRSDSQAAPRSLLKWGNGDCLWGHPVSAREDTLTWKSPLFASPLQLDLGVLSEIRYENNSTPEPAADSYWITFANRNVMSGRLVDVTADKLVFENHLHGRYSVLRNRVQSLQRGRDERTIYVGPDGLEGWQAEATFGGQAWQEEPSGAIRAPRGNGTLTRRLTLGRRCEVELNLTFTQRPDFAFHFMGSTKSLAARIEVWDDTLVAAIGNEYAELMVMDEDVRSLHLHALVDSTAGILAVYSGTGRLLGRVESKGMKAVPRMLKLKAIDAPLTLKRIHVSGWSGELPQTLARGQNRIHLSDGSAHYGVLRNLSDGVLEIEPTEPDPAADQTGALTAGKRLFPIADVSQIFISAESSEDEPPDQAHVSWHQAQVSWHDGTQLTGTLVSLDSNSIELQTPNSDEVISCSLQGARSIHLPNTRPIEGQPDRLFFSGGSVSGTLTVEDSDIPIRWTPVGGRNSSALVSADNARFQRGKNPEQMALDTDRFPDVVYMKSGDVFPCAVQRTDDRHLYQASPVCVTKKILLDDVQAVEFGSSRRVRHEGFADDQWKKVSGNAQVLDNGTALMFADSGSFAHAGVLTGDSISFHMKWSPHTYGSVGLFLFCDDVSSPDSATPVTFQLQQQVVGVHNRPLPDHNGGFWGFNAGDQQSMLITTDCTADVRITLDDGRVTVELDNKSRRVIDATVRPARQQQLHQVKLDKVRRVFDLNHNGGSGRGFLIRSSFLNVHVGNRQPEIDNGVRGKVELTDFVVKNTAGVSTRQFIRAEARELALTVPRFRRDDPLTHVLLAPNGDLLRGRLQEINEREVVFDSRLETFRFPRARVASVVWVPDPDAPVTPFEQPPIRRMVSSRLATNVAVRSLQL